MTRFSLAFILFRTRDFEAILKVLLPYIGAEILNIY
jgi:hypothetical protein